MNPRPPTNDASALELTNAQFAWRFDWAGGLLTSTGFENKLAGRATPLTATRELALVFSAALDRVAEPLLRADNFTVRAVKRTGRLAAVFTLHSAAAGLDVSLHVRLDGPTRRKWIEFTNTSGRELLLLDVELDDFTCTGAATGGGSGQPVFLDEEAFAALEHPSGDNRGTGGRVQLAHYPGRRLAPGAKFRSHTALVSVAAAGGVRAHFLDYLEARSRPRPGMIGVYTAFGINNQWGACPSLDDEQTLDVLNHLGQLRKRGVRFDYFTLDTGWVDPASDLTRFKPTAFPRGPGEMLQRARSLHLKFGLQFATSW